MADKQDFKEAVEKAAADAVSEEEGKKIDIEEAVRLQREKAVFDHIQVEDIADLFIITDLLMRGRSINPASYGQVHKTWAKFNKVLKATGYIKSVQAPGQ